MPTSLKPGDGAPEFSAPTGDGDTVSLADFIGKGDVVLYFYPRDNTPGCTREARAFRDAAVEIRSRGAEIVGVSTNSEGSHRRFAANQELNFPLLADTDGSIAAAYGVLKPNGRTAERATFLVDRKGVVRRVWPKVTVKGHAQEVTRAIDEMRED
ncbi:MAG: redoxin domain-containing protein [Candidatus Eisenbacteria bacterium]|nr:redoxin domain-containing protein [Candidatus Eisenbacteria bacterium]